MLLTAHKKDKEQTGQQAVLTFSCPLFPPYQIVLLYYFIN